MMNLGTYLTTKKAMGEKKAMGNVIYIFLHVIINKALELRPKLPGFRVLKKLGGGKKRTSAHSNAEVTRSSSYLLQFQ